MARIGMARIGSVSSPQSLGRLLQQARLARGLSQQQLAHELGISQGYVSELETGKASLALTRIFEVTRVTGMTMYVEVPEGSSDA